MSAIIGEKPEFLCAPGNARTFVLFDGFSLYKYALYGVIQKESSYFRSHSEKMHLDTMTSLRKHSSKIVLISFRNGTYWEEWQLRFNCGQKQNKPVKFFSTRTWRSDVRITLCPYSSSRFDSVSMKAAEEEFIATMRENEGEVFQSSIKIVKDLEARFGYEPVSASRTGWV